MEPTSITIIIIGIVLFIGGSILILSENRNKILFEHKIEGGREFYYLCIPRSKREAAKATGHSVDKSGRTGPYGHMEAYQHISQIDRKAEELKAQVPHP